MGRKERAAAAAVGSGGAPDSGGGAASAAQDGQRPPKAACCHKKPQADDDLSSDPDFRDPPQQAAADDAAAARPPRANCCAPTGRWLAGSWRRFNGSQTPADAAAGARWVPEEDANWISKAFFAFVNGLVSKGAAKHLEQGDLWSTARKDEPGKVWAQFEAALAKTATPAAPQVRMRLILWCGFRYRVMLVFWATKLFMMCCSHPLDSPTPSAYRKQTNPKRPTIQGRLWSALWRAHGPTMLWTGLLKVVHDAVMFSQPFILEQLLRVLTGKGSADASQYPLSERMTALGLAFALLGAAMVEALMINVYFNALFR
jgi:hypothetical protein